MKIIKCGIFLFPKLDKKYLSFAWFLVGSFLRSAIPKLLKLNTESNNLKILLTQNYFDILRNILSDLIIGIFHFIYIIKNKDEYKKRSQIEYNNNITQIRFMFNNEKNRKLRIIKIIFIISFIDIICQLLLPISYLIEYAIDPNNSLKATTDRFYSLLFIDIISRYLLSLYVLKTYFYYHHYLAFILNFISALIFFIIDIIFEFNNCGGLYIAISIIKIILYSFEDILNKAAFTSLYLYPRSLVFYKGIFQLVVYLPIITILFFAFHLHDFEDLYNFFLKQTQLFICFVPFNVLRSIYLVEVIDKFSVQHMSFLRVSESLLLFIFLIFIYLIGDTADDYNIKLWALIIQIFAFIILLLSTLIHNEIIIINHPKFKEKTEYYLNKDADREKNCSYNSDTLISYSTEMTNNSETNLYSNLTGSDML